MGNIYDKNGNKIGSSEDVGRGHSVYRDRDGNRVGSSEKVGRGHEVYRDREGSRTGSSEDVGRGHSVYRDNTGSRTGSSEKVGREHEVYRDNSGSRIGHSEGKGGHSDRMSGGNLEGRVSNSSRYSGGSGSPVYGGGHSTYYQGRTGNSSLEEVANGVGYIIKFMAKTVGVVAGTLAIGTFVGVYAGYSLVQDKRKKQPAGTHFKESYFINYLKDGLITKIRDKGINISPNYKTKAQLLEEETEKNRVIEEERKRKLKILNLRRDMEDIVNDTFFGSGPKGNAKEIMDRLKRIGDKLSKIDPDYCSIEPNDLVHKAYSKKYGS